MNETTRLDCSGTDLGGSGNPIELSFGETIEDPGRSLDPPTSNVRSLIAGFGHFGLLPAAQ